MENYNENSDDGISDLLVGRRIVRSEIGRVEIPDDRSWSNMAEGVLVLDDGTELYLRGNEGCGGCSSGWYELSSLASVDNVITRAEIYSDPADDYSVGEGVYSIFVFADNEKINVAKFNGSDGNGYYGTGFSIVVVRPQSEEN